jgi:2-amino-4-hydroxy-6-hydroxymethyldihydropteridine diphosphokinase
MEFALSLGSNLGDRLGFLRTAREQVRRLPGVKLVASAPVYETEPVNAAPEHQEKPYLNSIIIIESNLSPESLAAMLHDIEKKAGRLRSGIRNEPRCLDIDIIYAGAITVNTAALTIPHPAWAARRFVVQPLANLRPGLVVTGQRLTVIQLLLTLPATPKVVSFCASWQSSGHRQRSRRQRANRRLSA